MNSKQSHLTFGMAFLFLVVFVFFGVIIVKEKTSFLLEPRIEKKFNSYLENNYTSIISSLNKGKTTYKNNSFTMKLTSKKNKNLSFYLTYSNKKITDTYKEDYIKGTSFLKYISNSIEKDIKNKINKDISISINTSFDSFTSNVQNKLLSESDLSSLSIYTLSTDFTLKDFSPNSISSTILNFTNSLQSNNITPKSYSFTISDKSDITKAIKISNLTPKIISSSSFSNIINDIYNDKNSSLIKDNKITYKYLN